MPRPEDNEEMGLRVRNDETKAYWKNKRQASFEHRMEEISKLAMHSHHVSGDVAGEDELLEKVAQLCQNLKNDRVVAKMPRPLM